MIKQETLDSPISGSIRNETGAGWLACLAGAVALAGSFWAALAGTGCGECHEAGALLPGIPLAWAGVAYYAILTLATGWRGVTRWVKSGFFAAVGVHAVLLSLLILQHIVCGACLLVALAALSGAGASLVIRPRALGWAALPFVLAVGITLSAVMATRVHTPPPASATTTVSAAAQDLPDGTTATRPGSGHVKLVLYEREGCKHCLQFDEEILPPLQEALGTSLEIERREPTLDMETPTIVVIGRGSTTFTGVPIYKDLETAAIGLR